MAGALDGLRVFDLSDGVAGQYCTRLMADYGADVWLIEPQGGSPLRNVGPFRRDGERPHDSLLFWHLNTGKRSVVVEGSLLRRAAANADVVVAGPDHDLAALRRSHPALITCSITDFGPVGPRAGWKGSEMIYQALSGFMLLTGDATRQPLYGVGHRNVYSAGVTAYDAILAALFHRGRTGEGQGVAVNAVEATAAMNGLAILRYSYNGGFQRRASTATLVSLVECQDGWVVLYAALPDWAGVCDVFGIDTQYKRDPRFVHLRERNQHWADVYGLLRPCAAKLPVAEVACRAQAHKVPVGRVMTPQGLWESEHLRARGYWESVDGRPILGPAFRMSETPRRVEHGAPGLGEHQQDLGAWLALSPAEQRALRDGGVA